MSKYNVGDRVTVNGDFAPDVPEGSIGTIEDTTYSGAEVRIDGDWGGDTWFYYDNELEPYVEPSASSKHVALIVNIKPVCSRRFPQTIDDVDRLRSGVFAPPSTSYNSLLAISQTGN